MPVDYTLVLGCDKKHLEQAAITTPTYFKNKPSFLKHPMVVFFDESQVSELDVRNAILHPDLTTVPWPPDGVDYEGDEDSKFHHPQRYKMLAGFVHVPAKHVRTRWWLKLDTDVVATGNPHWVSPKWFKHDPVIVAHPWGYTKPQGQMLELDKWVEDHRDALQRLAFHPSLDLVPEDGSSRLSHKRIISWCAFFDTGFTGFVSSLAEKTMGRGKLPVPSQDGYLWYVAKRCRWGVERVNMKSLGWQHWSTMKNVIKHAEEAMR